MTRRKKGRAVHGWLVLDKPVGMTSTQAVGAVRRAFDARKAGHAGTLDPLATGILPIALGEATKTVPYAVDGQKSYRFTVRWGAETDTDDAEGRSVKTSEVRPDRAAIEAVLGDFTGEIEQVPPAFSAIKIDGNRAYDLARSGEEVVLEARLAQIDRLDLVGMPDADTAEFEADCGRGTYVRALVAGFAEADAVTMERLQAAAAAGPEEVEALLLPIEAALSELAALAVGQNDAARLLRGQAVLIRGRDAPLGGGATYATCKGHLIAVGHIEKGELRPTRVFNFSEGH
jgi:tRNA pseudouridine55 synthase